MAMADMLSFSPENRARIDTSSAWEIRQWCIKFGCTERQLGAAVRQVGVFAEDIRTELRQPSQVDMQATP
jgi:hypothetical protein